MKWNYGNYGTKTTSQVTEKLRSILLVKLYQKTVFHSKEYAKHINKNFLLIQYKRKQNQKQNKQKE